MASELTLRNVRYLVTAVDRGSMAEAARTLHVSPSAVSQAVTAMEQLAGGPLLLRVPHRPLALTSTGAAVIGDLRRMVAATDDVVATMRSSVDEAVGPVRIGCFRTIAPTHVPPLAAAVAAAVPAVRLEVEELPLDELQQALLDGRIEFGLLYDLDIEPEIEIEVLVDNTPHILLPDDHPNADDPSIPLAALAAEPFVLLDVPPSRRYFESILDRAGIDPPIAHVTGSLETLRSLVARGQGWSMLIQRPAITVSYEGLPVRTVTIADRLDPMPVVTAWPRGTSLTRRAAAVLDVCRQLFASDAADRPDARSTG